MREDFAHRRLWICGTHDLAHHGDGSGPGMQAFAGGRRGNAAERDNRDPTAFCFHNRPHAERRTITPGLLALRKNPGSA